MSSNGACIFCAIAAKRVPAAIVAETEALVAFLDIQPIRPGHVQIVPREHYPYFDDIPPALLAEMMVLAQKLARSLKAIFGVERVGFAFTGVDIAHAHGHVVPLVAPDDLTSRRYIAEEVVTYRVPPRPPHEDMARNAERIRRSLEETS